MIGRTPAERGRSGQIGALLLGIYGHRGLEYAGHVGTGTTRATLARLLLLLEPIRHDRSPLDTPAPAREARYATSVQPRYVAEIDYPEWTQAGASRRPSSKALGKDYGPHDVRREWTPHVLAVPSEWPLASGPDLIGGQFLVEGGTPMEKRTLGRTGATVSVVGLGTWQLGGDWGQVSEREALTVLETAALEGVTFFDTADVYGDGRSEQLIGRFLRERGGREAGITVATKMGRRAEQVPANYVLDNFRLWTDRSRRNLGVDTLDLVQLHCPPTSVYFDDAVYEGLDTLVEEGVIANYGVSVETVDEALAAITRPHVSTVQIITNAFRLKPLDQVFPAAAAAGVGLIVRVPLASGLLSGRYDAATTFPPDDHRNYNRDGTAFDVGETFSGVDYATGVIAAREFAALVGAETPLGTTPAQAAIAWLWQHPEVSTVIPGARNIEQARANAAAGHVPPLSDSFDRGIRRIYDEHLRAAIHPQW